MRGSGEHDRAKAYARQGSVRDVADDEFADITATTRAAFVQAPASPFSATTASIARDSLLLGLSADIGLADGVALFAAWQAALGGPSSIQTGRIGLRFAF